MKRAGILSLLLVLATLAASLPLSESLAAWSLSAEAHHHGKRKHSRAWWRRRRAWLRRQRALRDARHRRRAEAAQLLLRSHGSPAAALNPAAAKIVVPSPAALRASLPVPGNWSASASPRQGEVRFNALAGDGRTVLGTAHWSRVGAAPADVTGLVLGPRTKMLGGVPTTSLRRTVIDRMIAEGGWVINDFERQLGGQRVFVVVAQSNAADGSRRTWTFYFTEHEGHIYSLAAHAPAASAGELAAQSEQFLTALALRRPSDQATAQAAR
ncbi:MAG: hypothetical protein ACRD9R_00015 [Pyrinomonadaceae bacterium]